MSGPVIEPGESRIGGRTAEGWIVGNKLYRPSLLVSATVAGTLPDWRLEDLSDARRIPDIGPIELLLVGTGDTLVQPNPHFVETAAARGWRVEVMDTAAAARTFNVLVAEERLVGALLL